MNFLEKLLPEHAFDSGLHIPPLKKKSLSGKLFNIKFP
jgi:hypothetical protein